jgi:hypothetical protein
MIRQGHNKGKAMKKKGCWIGAIALLGLFVGVSEVGATHFRFGHLTWKSDETTRVTFTFTTAFRRTAFFGSGIDGFVELGDNFRGPSLCFGDGTCTLSINFTVTAVNRRENWVVGIGGIQPGEKTIEHRYFAEGEFLVFGYGCCRISPVLPPNAHINNPDEDYRIETKVLLRSP